DWSDIKNPSPKTLVLEDFVYVLLNKPRNVISTTSDPEGRQTVLDLVKDATDDRIFPVGRLDRNTTGLLLITNDGGLTNKLTHPSFEIEKLYHVTTDRPIEERDIEKLKMGILLDDGSIKVDAVSRVAEGGDNEVGLRIHSGRNRIVRRMFEHLGYEVEKLDRVQFAFLTKKHLPRGEWRHLTKQEVGQLKGM
ncbi:MAG: pseudouridine synthase, partial [Bacteroidota bacterium]